MDEFCGYSSIDVHNQYALEMFVSKEIVGIVVALCDNIPGSSPIWNAFCLSEEYRQRVEKCSKEKNLPNIQHAQCDTIDHFFLFGYSDNLRCFRKNLTHDKGQERFR